MDYKAYWQDRYESGGDSGAGSYGNNAIWKSTTINRELKRHGIYSVIEFGCGDGYQLSFMRYPQYLGLDVAPAAVERCRKLFKADKTKGFEVYDPAKDRLPKNAADMAISLDMLMHVTDDADYERTLEEHFNVADKLVVICTALYPHYDYTPSPHMAHRDVLGDVKRFEPYWVIERVIYHPSVTKEEREAGKVGDNIADFVVLTRG